MMRDSQPPKTLTSLFEAARLGWNVQLTCLKCGHQVVMDAAGLWLKMFQRGKPDDLNELARRGTCTDCRKRGERVARARARLVRAKPNGAPLPQPTERQWKEGLAWQRR